MRRFGALVFLFLCLNISDSRAQECQEFKDGYKKYFQCILHCYKMNFGASRIDGDFCTSEVSVDEMSPESFTSYQIEFSLNCIARQCLPEVPPSVCAGSSTTEDAKATSTPTSTSEKESTSPIGTTEFAPVTASSGSTDFTISTASTASPDNDESNIKNNNNQLEDLEDCEDSFDAEAITDDNARPASTTSAPATTTDYYDYYDDYYYSSELDENTEASTGERKEKASASAASQNDGNVQAMANAISGNGEEKIASAEAQSQNNKNAQSQNDVNDKLQNYGRLQPRNNGNAQASGDATSGNGEEPSASGVTAAQSQVKENTQSQKDVNDKLQNYEKLQPRNSQASRDATAGNGEEPSASGVAAAQSQNNENTQSQNDVNDKLQNYGRLQPRNNGNAQGSADVTSKNGEKATASGEAAAQSQNKENTQSQKDVNDKFQNFGRLQPRNNENAPPSADTLSGNGEEATASGEAAAQSQNKENTKPQNDVNDKLQNYGRLQPRNNGNAQASADATSANGEEAAAQSQNKENTRSQNNVYDKRYGSLLSQNTGKINPQNTGNGQLPYNINQDVNTNSQNLNYDYGRGTANKRYSGYENYDYYGNAQSYNIGANNNGRQLNKLDYGPNTELSNYQNRKSNKNQNYNQRPFFQPVYPPHQISYPNYVVQPPAGENYLSSWKTSSSYNGNKAPFSNDAFDYDAGNSVHKYNPSNLFRSSAAGGNSGSHSAKFRNSEASAYSRAIAYPKYSENSRVSTNSGNSAYSGDSDNLGHSENPRAFASSKSSAYSGASSRASASSGASENSAASADSRAYSNMLRSSDGRNSFLSSPNGNGGPIIMRFGNDTFTIHDNKVHWHRNDQPMDSFTMD